VTSVDVTSHLERALAAEDEVDALKERVKDLEARLKGVLGSDPTTAVRALSWIHRAENGEKLIRDLVHDVNVGQGIRSTDLPPGWLASAEAQLAALQILKRDQEQMAERPSEDESWEQMKDGQVRRIDLARGVSRRLVP
jgi:hypothetical protein